MAVAIGLAMMGGIATAVTASATTHEKVWVCKYVSTPGDETPQHANAIISVSTDTLKGFTGDLPYSFADAQVLSMAFAFDPPEATLAECPIIIELPTLSATRVCNAVGTVNAVDTANVKWSFTGEDTARMYTATAIGNFVLFGTNPQGPFDVSAIPSQSTNPNGACFVPPTTTVAAPTFTPGTCVAVGSVVANGTAAYSWVFTGPATARVYTAVAKAGHTLTGRTSWTFNLSKIASQSTNPKGACYLAPLAPPKPVVAGVVENAPVVAGVVKNAPVVAGVVENAPAVKSLAFTGAETIPLGLSGLLALVLGAVLTVASRQRPKQARE